MKLQDIRRPKGAHTTAKRVGRGSGSGHGKTSCRGSKGAKARSGCSLRVGFEGGQMPLFRRIPKRGFVNFGKKAYQTVNIERLKHFKKDTTVDKEALKKAGLIRHAGLPVKVLGDGKISKPLHVTADAFSESAQKKIVEAGGKAEAIRKGTSC
jgi:large subunit ribosomal protein L15